MRHPPVPSASSFSGETALSGDTGMALPAALPLAALEDDPRPLLLAEKHAGRAVALATILEAKGGPSRSGATMVVAAHGYSGFLSGGCIDSDVETQARAVLADGAPRRLRYGSGSPFIDLRLTCGGWIELLIERIPPDDPALAAVAHAYQARHPLWWRSDGVTRDTTGPHPFADPRGDSQAEIAFVPRQRLVVVGGGVFSLAIAQAGLGQNWDVTLCHPFGPQAAPKIGGLAYRNGPLEQTLRGIGLDRWTALAAASHDDDLDDDALLHALASDAGYIGVLGSRTKIPDRARRLQSRLDARGLPDAVGLGDAEGEAGLRRIRAPIGLPIHAVTPREVAVAVLGEILDSRRPLPAPDRRTDRRTGTPL